MDFEFVSTTNMFIVKEVGYLDNYYCGVGGHHWVILAENNK